jgi:acyl-CoA synthetase (AMP-forming)/AMP-acid ligase II
VTSFLGIPTMLMALLESLEEHPYDMSSVAMVTSDRATVAPELVRNIRRVFGCEFETKKTSTRIQAALAHIRLAFC